MKLSRPEARHCSTYFSCWMGFSVNITLTKLKAYDVKELKMSLRKDNKHCKTIYTNSKRCQGELLKTLKRDAADGHLIMF